MDGLPRMIKGVYKAWIVKTEKSKGQLCVFGFCSLSRNMKFVIYRKIYHNRNLHNLILIKKGKLI